ncbi:MAG: hypothetical protein A2091_05850 [Desulfuromonadales bacterium GWD2_61_12]|nr:MAG: hypothetical protein A2005_06850 [Desulfuromonadales bacterium GWC2_61_20]OGR33253.1 MAG: hypothetical protein A2091_05850 [Desulfuromonadales bacterium GWD2_61_12]HBT83072.1 restriction endonuclease subunit M [Desulfuromonas sp.]
MNDLSSTLEKYGADIEVGLREFEEPNPELLSYATLIAARNLGDSDLKALWGVYEWQSTPLVFLVNGDEIQDDDHFRRIRRRVALRGDAPYLGIVRPGQLTIHAVSLDKQGREASQLTNLQQEDKRVLFPYLANSRPGLASQRNKWISSIVLKLLRDAIETLRKQNISGNDAISLTGRALFLRFLGDRKLLPGHLGQPNEIFNDVRRAEAASQWLDVTFNGDFLPCAEGLLATLPGEALHPLGNIMHRAVEGQLHLGWEEKWDYLDFAHIPVGVLSEAYEHYMREHDRKKQRKEGSFYTPRAIADLMVNASFLALRRDGKSTDARVLDPAAGAGVFLISAFRQLVVERWVRDNKRPDTRVLREILYNQLVGFDINEAALRFAALGLYLMSIELDPEPEPVEKLRFKQNLQDKVLYNLGNDTSGDLGSLGKAVSDSHIGSYDLVIGNPPWASSTQLEGWSEVLEIVATIARERLPNDSLSSLLPNEVLDLPFVWRAMTWAKPSGQIAFALHGRLLFLQSDGMTQARSNLFRAFDVSGVINGSELRQTRVWPEITAPFCLLFARNQLPPHGAAFRFITPHLEEGLNNAGAMRIDAANAEFVSSDQLAERPELLKVLFRGTALDLEVINRMSASGLVSLEDYWRLCFREHKGKPRQTGNGYQLLRRSTKKPQDATDLQGLPELSTNGALPLLIDTKTYPPFKHLQLHRVRDREIYRKPLLIVHESLPVASGRIRVAVSESDLIFNQSYHGYSTHGHPHENILVRYLALLLGSNLAIWWVLMTSGRFGVEREVAEKITIDSIPIVPFESLDSSALASVDYLFGAIVRDDSPENWAKVDAWAASLYGLNDRDSQVIEDTLRYNLPFAANKHAAQKPPVKQEMAAFCAVLKNELAPWAKREGLQIDVQPKRLSGTSPWSVLSVRATAQGKEQSTLTTAEWPEILQIADRLASTEVILPDPVSNCLWIARLNQARYWSKSQARLVARRIVWENLDTLFGSEAG